MRKLFRILIILATFFSLVCSVTAAIFQAAVTRHVSLTHFKIHGRFFSVRAAKFPYLPPGITFTTSQDFEEIVTHDPSNFPGELYMANQLPHARVRLNLPNRVEQRPFLRSTLWKAICRALAATAGQK